jgi:FdhE protein
VPYLAVAEYPREELNALAEGRWRARVAVHPELGPAADLQRRLLSGVLDVAAAIDGNRQPRLSLPPRYLAAKLARGVPAFAGEPIPLPVPLLRSALVRFCRDLASGGAGEVAAHIIDALEHERLDAGSLLTASLGRDQHAVRSGATQMGLAPDLLWLVAELAVGPVAHTLQRVLYTSAASPLADALAGWNEGYCPACGSWPALAEVVGGHRLMRCSLCSTTWELGDYSCVYCREAGDRFVTAAPDEMRKDRRLELCGACGAYLKTIDVFELSPFPLVAIADLETMDLDSAAIAHHYARPPLRGFKTGSGLQASGAGHPL